MSLAGGHAQLVEQSRATTWLASAPGAVYLLAALALGLALTTDTFLSAANLTNVALQVAVLVIVALGMTLVILTEGIDLSLGPVLGLCGVVMGMMVVSGSPLWLAIGAAVLIGAAFGVTGLLRGLLFGVTPADPVAFLGVATFVVSTAYAACFIPGWRLIHRTPWQALREQ